MSDVDELIHQLQSKDAENRCHAALIPGALLFGLGWGLVGACPGTVLAMSGEGKLGAFFTIVGIALGTYLYGWQSSEDTQLTE